MAEKRGRSAARLAAVVVPLLLALGLVAVLAYQAQDADRRHRETAERTVEDYAGFAAYILEVAARDRLARALQFAFYRELLAENRDPATLPPPEILAEDGELERCSAVYDPEQRYFFRLNLRTGELAVSGPASPALRDWIADTVAVHAATAYGDDWFNAHIFGRAAGERRAIAYRVRMDAEDRPWAAYGFNTCLHDDGGPVFRLSDGDVRALPPSLTGTAPNDSLFSVTVTDPTGATVYASPVRYASPFRGTTDRRDPDPLGGLRLAVAVRPEVAARLVAGGIPPTRLPLTAGIVVLTIVLMVVTVVQIRRSYELIRVREQFIRNVSHELRTPLQQMLLFVQLVRMGRVESAEERRGSLEIVEQETRRLIRLVENVLQFSRLRSDDARLARAPVELDELLRETAAAFRPLAESRNVTVSLELRDAPRVRSDRHAIRQIVLNLLDNAVKYGPEGQTVRLGLSRGNGAAVITVDDEGPGIPPADRDRIWSDYYRLDRDEDGPLAGSGVGLSIVRELVRRLGGTVTVESPPAGGARFAVRLPLNGETEPSDADASETTVAAGSASP